MWKLLSYPSKVLTLYNEIDLIRAVHPRGVDAEICPDYQHELDN